MRMRGTDPAEDYSEVSDLSESKWSSADAELSGREGPLSETGAYSERKLFEFYSNTFFDRQFHLNLHEQLHIPERKHKKKSSV